MPFTVCLYVLMDVFIPQAFFGYQYSRIFVNVYNEAIPEFFMILAGVVCLADFLRVNLFVRRAT